MGRSLLIVLDTHVVVWLAFEETRISRRAQTAIDNARQSTRGLAISDFTLFELSLLFRKKKFAITISPEAFLAEVERRGFANDSEHRTSGIRTAGELS
jgi:PIN domain nuclease of toxin-antitoxin system